MTPELLAPFWYVRGTPDADDANVELSVKTVKLFGKEVHVPVLINSTTILEGTTLNLWKRSDDTSK